MCYDDWYHHFGYKIEEDIQDWLNSCPSSFIEIDYFDIQDILDSEFESLIGELEDRAYDEYKDSLLDDN